MEVDAVGHGSVRMRILLRIVQALESVFHRITVTAKSAIAIKYASCDIEIEMVIRHGQNVRGGRRVV